MNLANDKSFKDNMSKHKMQKTFGGDTSDMMPELLAVSEKLISEDKRRYYNDDNDDELDDNIDDVISNGPQNRTKFPAFSVETDAKKKTNIFSEDDAYEYSDIGGTAKIQSENMSDEELIIKKLDMMRKLKELVDQGVKISQNFTLDSDLKLMEYEWRMHRDIRSKKKSIEMINGIYMGCIWALEKGNSRFDPFGVDLDGWSDFVAKDSADYYDVYSELYEKYNTPGKSMAPEVKLILMLGASAIKLHMSKMSLDMMPDLSSVINSDPNLVAKLRQQAASNSVPKQDVFASKIEKEHSEAIRKAQDLNMLREKELEQANMMRMNAERKAQTDQFMRTLKTQKENIVSVPIPSNTETMSPALQNILKQQHMMGDMISVDVLKNEQMKSEFLHQEVENMRRQMQEMEARNRLYDTKTNKSKTSKTSKTNKSTASAKSTVSINPRMTEIFTKALSAESSELSSKLDSSDQENMTQISFSNNKKAPKNSKKTKK